ncbi:MAG TPA: hypothetical protein DCZ95_17620 [Verrucomicrobia bacterium]|nr:MAG: hypothetical protein A2X46_12250 [Lentisphaerae bacterium GWF2_57_35]HBA85906.1 hypothetical protein [Verrucomicrobiota bacterium]
MKKAICGFVALMIIGQVGLLFADPPSPQEVASTVSNLWIGQEFVPLGSYITNLYMAYSSYMPAILSSSFHDYIFLGELASASNKLNVVKQAIDSNPLGFPEAFKARFNDCFSSLQWEIALHERKGRTPETVRSNAFPSTIRNAWGMQLPPAIDILFYTPATNAP